MSRLLLAALVGCVQLPYPGLSSTGASGGWVDADGDGFADAAAGGEDCDDARPEVNPEQPEICGDQLDNNCDGAVDDVGEGAVPQFVDADVDGYGGPSGVIIACVGALGPDRVTIGGDCNDADGSVHPGVLADSCDQIDNDCDGTVDEDEAVMLDGQRVTSVRQAFLQAPSVGTSVIEVCRSQEVGGLEVRSGQHIVVRGIGPSREAVVLTGSSTTPSSTFEVHDGGALALESLAVKGGPWHAVEALGASELTLDDVVLQDHGRSAIHLDGSGAAPADVSVFRSTLDLNGSDSVDGGGLHAEGWYEIEIVDSVVSNNRAEDGAGLYLVQGAGQASTVTLINADVVHNEAVARGGGVFGVGVTISAVSALVASNEAQEGGGLHLREATVEGGGTSSSFNNVAASVGGGLHCFDSSVTGWGFESNTAQEGGGVYSTGTTEGVTYTENRLIEVELTGNIADQGGGLFVLRSRATLVRSAVERNTAARFFPGSKILIDGQGGGAYLQFSGTFGALLRSIDTSWGVIGGDNDPEDIWHDAGESYRRGLGETFDCRWDRCLD